MIKKILSILVVLITLSACGNVFSLEEKYYFNSDLIEIENLDTLNKLEEDKESFVVFVYMPNCSTCASFKPIVEEFINMNELTFYSISTDLIFDNDNSIMKKIEYAPSILIYKKGKVKAYLDANADKDVDKYEKLECFSDWFMKYVEIKVR